MARRTIVELIDDIDGSKAETTVQFGLDGVAYEIDLSEENATKLRADFASWVEQARRVSGRRTARRTGGAGSSSSETSKIRDWARENGVTVSDRGRISAEVRKAYYEAVGN